MITVKNNLGGGANKVLNGVLGEYKAYATAIEPMSFVDFVSDLSGTTSGLQSINSAQYTGRAMFAVVLDDTRVLFIHSYGSNDYIYGCIITIENETMTVGASIVLTTSSIGQYICGMFKTKDNEAVMFTTKGITKRLYAFKIAVSGETITLTEMSNIITTNDCTYSQFAELSKGKFFVSSPYYSSSSRYWIDLMWIELDENYNLSLIKTVTSMDYVYNSLNPVFVSRLDDKRAVLYSGGQQTYSSSTTGLKAWIVTLDNDNIIYGTAVAVATTSYAMVGMALASGDNTAAFAFTDSTNNLRTSVKFATIEGNTITLGQTKALHSISVSSTPSLYNTNIIYIGNGNYLYAGAYNSNYNAFYGLANAKTGEIISKTQPLNDQCYHNNYYRDKTLIKINSSMFFALSINSSNMFVRGFVTSGRFDELISVNLKRISGVLVEKATPTRYGKVYTLG